MDQWKTNVYKDIGRREFFVMDLDKKLAGKPRMANMELLRIISMMMVVVLHFLGKGNLLGDLTQNTMGAIGVVAWLLESLCIVAVNVYMLISGYFLCEASFKLSRLLGLWLQVWTYSVVVGVIAALVGLVPAEEMTTYYFIQILFPVSMGQYWFLTAYVFLYILLPFLGMAIMRMTKKQLQLSLTLLLLVFCIVKSLLPVRFDMDNKGYDCLWYLCVFCVAAYIKRFGVPFLQKKKRGILLYLLAAMSIFGATMCMHMIYVKTERFELVLTMFSEYNHIFVLLASLGLFLAFLHVKVPKKCSSFICKISACTLGVYLLHENIGVRYLWQDWLGAGKVNGIPGLLLATLIAVFVVFVLGIVVEMLRKGLMFTLHKILMHICLYRKLQQGLMKADAIFCREAIEDDIKN